MTMRWEDERYVRFYTRNTIEWLSMSWQARGLFGLLLREVDRAGILPLGKVGIPGLAVVLRAEWADLEGPIHELLTDGCVQLVGDQLVIPNFIEAQEAAQSDAARQKAKRERDRDLARAGVMKRDAGVTKRDSNVTSSHVTSHDVTPSLPSHPSEPSVPHPPLPPNGGGGKVKALPGRKAQRSFSDLADPSPAPLGRALELIRDHSCSRFVVSHVTRTRERRNGALEQATMGLPQVLWDRLRHSMTELGVTEEQAVQLGKWIAAGGWKHLDKVTPDYLLNHLSDGLTRAMAWDGTALGGKRSQQDQAASDDRPQPRDSDEVIAEIWPNGRPVRAAPGVKEPTSLGDILTTVEGNLGQKTTS